MFGLQLIWMIRSCRRMGRAHRGGAVQEAALPVPDQQGRLDDDQKGTLKRACDGWMRSAGQAEHASEARALRQLAGICRAHCVGSGQDTNPCGTP